MRLRRRYPRNAKPRSFGKVRYEPVVRAIHDTMITEKQESGNTHRRNPPFIIII
jgi:hypothetical protein